VLATLTWDNVKKLVMSKFFPTIERDKIEREFIMLEARTMTLHQYTTKFDEMARLLPELVQPESQRVKQFVQGLPCKVWQLVKISAPQTYESAIALSAIAYTEEGVMVNENKRKRIDEGNHANTR
jgi:hypothetical protein